MRDKNGRDWTPEVVCGLLAVAWLAFCGLQWLSLNQYVAAITATP